MQIQTTSKIHYFRGRFSLLSTLCTPLKLKLFNCSDRHHLEKIMYRGSMIKIIIPENYFIMFHCGLVHYGTCRGEYSSNTRTFFTITENNFNLTNESTIQMDNQLCTFETYDVCNNNKFATVEQNGPLIDLRKLRNQMQRLMIIKNR